MKKFFTLLVALVSATTIFAQTAAQELPSVFTGSAKVASGKLYWTAENQTVSFAVNASDNSKVDMSLTDVSISAMGYTITMKATTAEGFAVTKSGNSYALDDHKFTLVLNNGSGDADVTANVTSSDISIVDKAAEIKMHVTDLPAAMKKMNISSLDVTYTLTLDHVAGINDITSDAKTLNGKFLKNGKVTIKMNGKEYNANGQRLN